MEWSQRMNAAIDYIEDNLAGEIDFNKAAEKACCSTFHFQRIFFAINGVTPAEYARRRRLTQAARELTSSNARVIDIALKYGYESPDSFTRAFRNVHGVTPQAARKPGVKLTAFPRISFQIELKGGTDMDYRIMNKPAFDVVGKARKFTTEGGENFIKIPQFWDEFLKADECRTLNELKTGKPGPITGGEMLGACLPNENDSWDPFVYAIGIEKTDEMKTAGFDVFHIPATTWAVFECTLDNLQDVTRRIFSEWFPSTGYEHDDKPDIEVYLPEEPDSQVMRCQIWMPVVKKK